MLHQAQAAPHAFCRQDAKGQDTEGQDAAVSFQTPIPIPLAAQL